jgi:hypothetical protein
VSAREAEIMFLRLAEVDRSQLLPDGSVSTRLGSMVVMLDGPLVRFLYALVAANQPGVGVRVVRPSDPEPVTTRCPDCSAMGIVARRDESGGHDWCPRCGGTRRVPLSSVRPMGQADTLRAIASGDDQVAQLVEPAAAELPELTACRWCGCLFEGGGDACSACPPVQPSAVSLP